MYVPVDGTLSPQLSPLTPCTGCFLDTSDRGMLGFRSVIIKFIVYYQTAPNRGTWNKERCSLRDKYFHMSILVFVNVLELIERCGRCQIEIQFVVIISKLRSALKPCIQWEAQHSLLL